MAKESRSSWWWKWAALVKVNLLARLSQGSGRLIVLTRSAGHGLESWLRVK